VPDEAEGVGSGHGSYVNSRLSVARNTSRWPMRVASISFDTDNRALKRDMVRMWRRKVNGVGIGRYSLDIR
jgi:hypothetical protein